MPNKTKRIKSVNDKIVYISAMWLLIFVSSPLLLFAQARQIRGHVFSATDHKPLAGASITLVGTAKGTFSSPDGSFSVQAKAGDYLSVGFTGYIPQTVLVGSSDTMTIALMQNESNLNDVVVVGYGTQKRKDLTSSIATLDTKALASAPMANVGSALQGSVPGLQVIQYSGTPGSSPKVILRGGASISAPGNPLVVVDGIVRDYNDIAPEDIESVTILKDASATAIYGARANNGVILITTKQGKDGKAQITYKFTNGYNKNRKDYQYLDAHDYIYYNRMGNLNSGRTYAQVNQSRGYGLLTDAANLASFDIRLLSDDNSYLLSDGWQEMPDPYNADGQGRNNTIIYKDHSGEIADILFRNTNTQDHYVSAIGGNDKGKFFSSFDYYNQDGIIVGSSYKRYTGTINGSYKVLPNVEVSSGANLSTASQYGIATSEANALYRTMALWPTFNPWLDTAKTQPNPGVGISDGNPLYWLQKMKRTNTNNKITANASVKWDIIKDLYVKATGSIYFNDIANQSYQYPTSNYTDLFAGKLTSYTRDAYSTDTKAFQQQYSATVNYSKIFNGKHDLRAMAGTEYYGLKNYALYVHGENAPTDDITTANASTLFPADGSNGSTQSQFAIVSTFGRLQYNYDQRYLLTAVFRSDAVSSLAPKNRVGYFPGFSAGWNIQNEQFFKNTKLHNVITTLKPRISYGVNGNISGLGYYEVQGVYASQGNYNGSAGFLNTGVVNNNLQWEKSATTDLGLDAGFLSDRITFTFDYYNRITSNLLTNLALPSYTGYSSFKTNLGTLQNKGYEFSVNANIITNPSGFSWSMSANASYDKNKIVKLPFNGNPNNRQGGLQVWDPKTKSAVWVGGYQEGKPIGDVYAFKELGIFKDDADVAAKAGTRYDAVAQISGPNTTGGSGKITAGDVNWMDVDGNDTINSLDQVYMGNIYPKWTGGFSTNLSYKNFSLYARFDFAANYIIYNDLVARTMGNYQGTFNYISMMKDSWTPDHENTMIPKVYYADQVSAPAGKKNYTRINNANANLNSNNSLLYEQGGYLACREITLSYNLSKKLLSRTKFFSDARIYVSANNLFYLSGFSGPAPEPPTDTNGNITGVYTGSYPIPKSFIIGAQVSF